MDPEHCLYLSHNGVQDLALEGAEDDGLVLDGIDDEPLAPLDQTRPPVDPDPRINASD